MGVYIKNMDKPNSCEDCPFETDYFGVSECMFSLVYGYNDCPLIKVSIGENLSTKGELNE